MSQPSPTPHVQLDLEHFLPYRLSVLSNRTSNAIAREYSERFDMTIPEWRVMAVLGRFAGLSANQVAQRTAMDKVAVSRAVAKLLESGRLLRAFDDDDRRRSVLRLSEAGYAIYDQIVPLADSGMRTHKAVKNSQMHVIKGGPHGCNLSHADEFNQVLIDFLRAT